MSYSISERELHTVWSVCPECDTQASVQIEIPSPNAFELLKSKNARMREALNFIVNNASSWGLEAEEYVRRARSALEGKE